MDRTDSGADRVVVVFESLLGNTHEIAEAVGAGLRDGLPRGHVTVVPVARADSATVAEAALLVVGGPTHGFSLTTPESRGQAVREHPDHVDETLTPEGPGLREWFAALPSQGGRAAAAFDTRVRFPLPGHAAGAIARQLRRRGCRLVAEPEGFVVTGVEGPLRPGELERAREWGASLAALVAAADLP